MQIPIGLEDLHKGVVDLLTNQCLIFQGDGLEYLKGDLSEQSDLIKEQVQEYRHKLFEQIANLDESIEE